MPSSESFVTVVVPIHNVSEFLAECLTTIVDQTYDNFEVLLIENHSTDDSRLICDEFVSRDERFRIVRPDAFLPQVANFNFGMSNVAEHASFVKMVLADDWIFPRCLAEMVASGEEFPTAGVIGAYRFLGEKGIAQGLPVTTRFMPGREAGAFIIDRRLHLLGTPNSVMYRADLVRARGDAFFPGRGLFWDTEVAFTLLQQSDFAFVHQLLTFSREWTGAITDRLSTYEFWHMAQLFATASFGRKFLDPADYDLALTTAERDVYRVLAKDELRGIVGGRVDGLVKFHEDHFRLAGIEIERRKVWRAAARGAARSATWRAVRPIVGDGTTDRNRMPGGAPSVG